jgi:hypothetical protein
MNRKEERCRTEGMKKREGQNVEEDSRCMKRRY